MLIVPKERSSLENLNSYYLDVDRLFDHFQGARVVWEHYRFVNMLYEKIQVFKLLGLF